MPKTRRLGTPEKNVAERTGAHSMMRISNKSPRGIESERLIEGDPLVNMVTGEDYHPDYQSVRYREARVIRLSLISQRNMHFTVEITRGIVESIIEQARREGWIKDASPQVPAEPVTTPLPLKPATGTLLPKMPVPDHIRRRDE
jgi:hypothetical protein